MHGIGRLEPRTDDLEVVEGEPVAVAELAETVEVEGPEEGRVIVGQCEITGVEHWRHHGLVVRHPAEEVEPLGRCRHSRGGQIRSVTHTPGFTEASTTNLVVPGNRRGGVIEVNTGEGEAWWTIHDAILGSIMAMMANRPLGCSARALKYGVDAPVG